MEATDFLFLSRCAETHSSAAYLAGTATWKKLVDVEAIAEYSDIYSQATYMNPQGQCSSASLTLQILCYVINLVPLEERDI